MQLQPNVIFEEYKSGVSYKTGMGNKGMYEQTRINERFFAGDQWYAANCGNSRPLVRHNVIKRIGDYKMAQILKDDIAVRFTALGIPSDNKPDMLCDLRLKIAQTPDFKFEGRANANEINLITKAFGNYRNVTAKRLKFDYLCEKALKNAYISGTGVVYTYWDGSVNTGLFADDDNRVRIMGDIKAEVLDIENVYFADPTNDDVQSQNYIIIASLVDVKRTVSLAKRYGADDYTLKRIMDSAEDGKVLTLTKLYKQADQNGQERVMCIKVTENAIIRDSYDTNLTLYPLALFRWNERKGTIYGDTDITYLIPNQIAINRMITANVWSAVTMGMPMMVVNGDTVTDNITNDPGQIIKVYGSNEDVAGAIKYVTPPDSCKNFGEGIETLIADTLAQSGANEVALGDSTPDNAAALTTMLNAATLPLELVKKRYRLFIEEISLIWAEFWLRLYKKRKLKIEDETGIWYIPFDTDRYKNLNFLATAKEKSQNAISENERLSVLSRLYEQGIIAKEHYLKMLPSSILGDIEVPLENLREEDKNDGI